LVSFVYYFILTRKEWRKVIFDDDIMDQTVNTLRELTQLATALEESICVW